MKWKIQKKRLEIVIGKINKLKYVVIVWTNSIIEIEILNRRGRKSGICQKTDNDS